MVHEGPSKAVRALARGPSGDPEKRFGSFGVYYWGAADEEPVQETWHPRGTPGVSLMRFFFALCFSVVLLFVQWLTRDT